MKFGLSIDQYQLLEDLVLSPLKKMHAQVYVFGSRSRGKHHPFSDLDLLYKEDPSFPVDESQISKIKEDIENSNFPIKVDLVNDKNLANSYRQSVEQDLVLIE